MEKALKETGSSVLRERLLRNTEKKSSRVACSSFQRRRKFTVSNSFRAILKKSSKKKNCLKVNSSALFYQNAKYLKRKLFPPLLKAACIRAIVFYQKYISRHTCLYEPTCSEYTKRCINNLGVISGIFLGMWRIMRCNPLSKGGYDPAPENPFKKKWLL